MSGLGDGRDGLSRRDVLRLVSLSAIGGIVGCDALPDGDGHALFRQPASASGFVPDVELVLTAAPDEVRVLPGAAGPRAFQNCPHKYVYAVTFMQSTARRPCRTRR